MAKYDFEFFAQAEADRRAGLVKNRLTGQSSSPMAEQQRHYYRLTGEMVGLSLNQQRLRNYSLSGLAGLASVGRKNETENKKLLLLGD